MQVLTLCQLSIALIIENITIIKDAAAASLYGSRAANGVVLITTKKGKSGKPQISFKADWGSSDFAMDYRPVMGGEERREYIYNGLVAGALRDGNSHDEAIAYANENIDDYAPVPWCGYVDWDDIMFKKEITRLMKPPFLVEQTNSNIIHLSLT